MQYDNIDGLVEFCDYAIKEFDSDGIGGIENFVRLKNVLIDYKEKHEMSKILDDETTKLINLLIRENTSRAELLGMLSGALISYKWNGDFNKFIENIEMILEKHKHMMEKH